MFHGRRRTCSRSSGVAGRSSVSHASTGRRRWRMCTTPSAAAISPTTAIVARMIGSASSIDAAGGFTRTR